VVDIDDPANPRPLGALPLASSPQAVAAAAASVYISLSTGTVLLADMSDPLAPVLVSTFEGLATSSEVCVVDSLVGIVNGTSGLFLVRFDSAPSDSARVVGQYDVPGYTRGVATSGSYVYLAARSDGLRVLDISNRAAPREAAVLDLGSAAMAVEVVGDRAYVTADDSGLVVVDVTEPSRPAVLGNVSFHDARGLCVEDSLVYAVTPDNWLRIIDVSDPADPAIVGQVELDDDANDVDVAGRYAYVAADDRAGLVVVDVGDPSQPVVVGATWTRGTALGVAVDGNLAYVADKEAGLTVIDVSDPMQPRILAGQRLPDDALDVGLSGPHALLACELLGVWAVNVSDPGAPWTEAYCIIPGKAECVSVEASYVGVAGLSCGFTGLELAPIAVEEVTESPSLRSGASTVVGSVVVMPASASALGAHSTLCDVAGRKVLDLKPGENDVSRLAPGVYFVRGQGLGARGEGSGVTKVIVAR
jgi:hypothetical protein